MVEVREYLSPDGTSPYAKWFDQLNAQAAAKVATAIARMAQAISRMRKVLATGFTNIGSTSDRGIEFILEERAVT